MGRLAGKAGYLERPVAYPVARPRAEPRRAVARVRQLAALQREAHATPSPDLRGFQMSDQRTASKQITDEVTSWPGVEAGPGRRGEFAFKVGRREIGHLHGDRAAHFSFPKDVWRELVE